MAISNEVLNTTFANLQGPSKNAFMRSNELWASLQSKAQVSISGGSYFERTFSGGAPARGVGIFVGDELLNMTRQQQIRRYQVEPHRLVVAINIPKKELEMNSGDAAVVRLIKEYPKSTLEAAGCDINSYLLTGASRGLVFTSSELYGLTTLNGDFGAGIGTGVTNGLLDFQAPNLQVQNVQNVLKSDSYYHFNQYAASAAWATDGMEIVRKTYRKCGHYANGKAPDLMIMDDDSFTNFEADKLANVRVRLVEDRTEKTDTLALNHGIAKVFSSIDLDRTLATFTTAAAQNGICYILNTDHMELCMQAKPKLTPFTERVGDQDVVTALFEVQFNMLVTNFPAQGVATNTAV